MVREWLTFGISALTLAASPAAHAVDHAQPPRVRIATDAGDVVVALDPERAPVTVANFLRYVDEGRYESASFYRVVTPGNQPDDSVKIEVVQGGIGFGESEKRLPPIEHEATEVTGILHLDGVISMARLEPGSASSEFFICVGDQPELDFGGRRNPDGQGFAAFGRVVAGMDVVRAIQAGNEEKQMLTEPVRITSVSRRAGHGHAPHAHHDDATSHHRFEDAEHWAKRFEDPERDAWQLPDSIVTRLVTRDDLVVADIGSATGYFPVRFARALGRGAVIGSDVEPDMVMYLNDRARREGLANLSSVLAAPGDPHLPRRADLVFLCNTVHHVDDRVEYFRRLREDQLTSGGRVAIVDFRLESKRGPAHKLAPETVVQEFSDAGYELVERYEFLPEQYFLVFESGRGLTPESAPSTEK